MATCYPPFAESSRVKNCLKVVKTIVVIKTMFMVMTMMVVNLINDNLLLH